MNSVKALRMTLQLDQPERGRFALAVFTAYWADDRDINDEAVLGDIAVGLGLDAAELLAGCADPKVKAELRNETEGAERLGVPGAPCFHVQADAEPGDGGGVLFWGQDRLLFVEKALQGWRPRVG
jgi:2-hydroxychromene-2-carboxylate isomerase